VPPSHGPAKVFSKQLAAALAAILLITSAVALLGLASVTVQTASAAPVIQMQDTTASSGQNMWSARPLHAEFVTPSSVLVGKQIDTIVLSLKKSGAPTGTAEIGVFNPDLSVKKLFATKDVSTFTTSYASYEFALAAGSSYTIASGDRIGIKYTGGTSTDNISIMRDTDVADPFDGANTYHTYYTTAWYTFTSTDLTMTLKLVNGTSTGGGGGGGTTGTFTDQVFKGGLTSPTAMAFAPDGRLFVAEKGGALRVIKNGVLLSQPFLTVPVSTLGERGLIGVAIDPNFSTNKYVYVQYTTNVDPIHNRVSRFTASSTNPDVAEAGSELAIADLDTLSGAYHNAGALQFGPDGKLYVAAGDNGQSSSAQQVSTRLGKVLRINSDGTIPADNPFYNTVGAKKEVWALGLRNPFTFAFQSGTGKMYINDVGKDTAEEINLGTSGGNYGWPTCEGACGNSNFIDPVYYYLHPSTGEGRAITGGAFYQASQFPPEYQGSYFFGDYVANFIKRLPSGSSQAVDFLSNTPTPVDIDVGPGGSLYYLSYQNGEVHKVQYSGGSTGNSIPTAVASANPTFGAPPLAVNFDGSGSTDPDGDPLTYSWNFGDGSAAGSGAKVAHTYSSAGQYTATLTVSDGKGGQGTSTVGITVGNPPVGTISAPVQGTKYSAGDNVTFSGSATDAEDGTLPASAFHWEVLLHHNTHTHPFQVFDGVKTGSFTIPQQSEADSDVFYRIYLTVTDSTGLKQTTTRDLLPNKSTITLASNVTAGIQLNLDGQPVTTPYSVVGVVGITRTLDAPLTQTVNGQTYNFLSWSDGGAATHTISTPAANTTYTASYVLASSGGGGGSAVHMQDTTASSGQNMWSGRPVHAEYVAPSSSLVGKQINSITVTLKKSGAPTGTAQVGIINPDLSMKNVFATLDVSTLTTSYKGYEFKSPSGALYTIAAGDRIGVKYSGGTSTDNISIMRDTDVADPFDGANTYHTYYTTAWYTFTSNDLTMTLKQN
jgi:glucose/arabinose dehydrogenase